MDKMIFGANWYVDTLNCRKRLEEVKLPTLSKNMEEFQPGGSHFALAIPDAIKELEAEFSLKGAHDDVRSLFGREPGDWTNFYYYERLRDIERGLDVGRVVQLRGLVSEVEQANVKGKKADATKYKVGSIVLYRDKVDGRNVHLFDFFNNRLVMDGVDYTAAHNRLIAA